MQRSFSIVEDDSAFPLEAEEFEDKHHFKNDVSELDLTDSEENNNSPKRPSAIGHLDSSKNTTAFGESSAHKPRSREQVSKLPSAGPSGRQTVLRRTTKNTTKLINTSSDSDDSDKEEKASAVLPSTYDPKKFEHLEVDDETREIFQYILKYTPQQLNLDYKFKPFIPEFLPGVGDIDAFLKIIPPDVTINGERFDEQSLHLGLTILDEPTLNQSDPALLYLQLRAASANIPNRKCDSNVVVKKIDNLEKNMKVIDKWIKDISDIHKSKLSSVIRYSEPMPDLDDLMQEWPEDTELKIKQNGFPKPVAGTSISDYVITVCNAFQIPISKKKIHSLHLLFCLYAAIKQTQLYQTSAANNEKNTGYQPTKKEADQLVLE